MSSAGLLVTPPKRSCDDSRCPFHGHIKVRGKILTGKVVSLSDKQTVVIEREFLFQIPKYNRYERRRGRCMPTSRLASRSRRVTLRPWPNAGPWLRPSPSSWSSRGARNRKKAKGVS